MRLVAYCELATRDAEGNVDGEFGMKLDLGEASGNVDYAKFTAGLDKAAVLDLCGLSAAVAPEDMKFITAEEYEAEYGDEEGDDPR